MNSSDPNTTTMRALLIATAMIEAATGLVLVASPSVPAALLFGTDLDSPTASAVGRIAGAALISLATACWFASHDEQGRAATGLVAAMLLYNTAAVALLTDANIRSGLVGIGLWPGVVLHLAMAAWCLACLRMKRRLDR